MIHSLDGTQTRYGWIADVRMLRSAGGGTDEIMTGGWTDAPRSRVHD